MHEYLEYIEQTKILISQALWLWKQFLTKKLRDALREENLVHTAKLKELYQMKDRRKSGPGST